MKVVVLVDSKSVIRLNTKLFSDDVMASILQVILVSQGRFILKKLSRQNHYDRNSSFKRLILDFITYCDFVS